MTTTAPQFIPIESQRRLRIERSYLAAAGCETCVRGCDCKLDRGDGCGHYACLATPAYRAETCEAARSAISQARSDVRGRPAA